MSGILSKHYKLQTNVRLSAWWSIEVFDVSRVKKQTHAAQF